MTKIHLQAAARLQRELDSLEKSVGVGWMPIPKPLTDEQIYESYRDEFDIMLTDSGAQNTIKRFARAVERAHGIGEKE